MKKATSIFLVSIFLLGCDKSEKEIAGVYIKFPSINTIDSLFIYADSIQPTKIYNRKVYKYVQRFYNKKTGEMLFVNSSTWWLNENGRLELDDLYLDADNNPDEYSHSKGAIKNALISSSLPISGSKIIVDESRMVFYEKVK